MFRILSSFSLRPAAAVVSAIVCLFAGRRRLRCAIVIAIAFLSVPASAQTTGEIAARHRKLIDAAKSDTARLNRMIAYASDISDYSKDSTLKLTQQILDESRKIGYDAGIGKAHELRATTLLFDGDFAGSMQASREALRMFRKINDSARIARTFTNIGFSYVRMAKLDSAVAQFFAAIAITPAKDSLSLAYPYNGLALSFANMSQIEKALLYCLKSEHYFRLKKDTANQVVMILNRSNYEGMLYRYDASGNACREVILLSDQAGYVKGQCMGRMCLGGHYAQNPERLDSAIYYLKQSEIFLKRYDASELDHALLYSVTARVHFAKAEYGPAHEYTQKALAISRKMGHLESQVDFNQLLTKVQIHRGDKAGALTAFGDYVNFRDSLQRAQMSGKVNELETKYRTLEKDKSLAEQRLAIAQKDLQIRKKNLQTALMGGGLLLVIAVAGGLYYRSRHQQQLQRQKLLLVEKESELTRNQAVMEAEEKERARIARNLHDGAGSILSGVKLYLSSLEMKYHELATSPQFRDTLGLLNEAVTEIRETSHNLMPKTLHLEGIHSAIRDYCDKIGRSGNLDVEFQSYGEPTRFDIDFELMVFRTVQELLGNVMKHAEAKQVMVQLTFSPDTFMLTVEDDGQGMDENGTGGGIGMFAVNSRVEAFRGTMDVDSSAGGTSITLQFPVPLEQTVKSE